MNAACLNRKKATDYVFSDIRFIFQQLLSIEVLNPRRIVLGLMSTLLFGANMLDYTHLPVFDKAAHFGSDFLRLFCKIFHKLCAE